MQKLVYNNAPSILVLIGTLYCLGVYITAAKASYTALIFGMVIPVSIFCGCGMLIQQLYRKSNTDHLTGLKTRAEFENMMERRSNLDKPSSLLIIDIDNFKTINDKYGHHVGDNALKALAAIVKRQVRADDSIIRWGGDEFVVILPGTLAEDALTIADRIRQSVKLEAFHFITVSIGIADTTHRSMDDALIAADQALYKAKTLKDAVMIHNEQPERVVRPAEWHKTACACDQCLTLAALGSSPDGSQTLVPLHAVVQ